MNRFAPLALALLGGALVALSIPPYSLWPLGILGIACYFVAAERAVARASTQFVVGAVFAWAWLAPGMGWMWQLVPGGFVVAPLLFAVWHGIASIVAARLAPRANSQSTRLLVRGATHSLVECLRFYAPFGGVPLASTALGVADTRLAGLARIAGALGVSLWLFVASAVVAALWLGRREFGWRARRGALITIAVLVGVQALAVIAPRGDDSGRTMRIAAVQGGGPQAVLAVDSNPGDVVARHFAATQLLDADDKIDLVVWPENAIDVREFATSKVRNDIAAEAQRLGAPFAVGVTEDAGDNFTNAQIVVPPTETPSTETPPDASAGGRYDKVLRVPYGEYVPLRGLLESLGAPVDRIPRDAVAGTQPAYIDVSLPSRTERLAIAISWEVFFSRRVNDGVTNGGGVVLNPTNGSSYTGEILQQQQVATSQLRAIESGRFVVQAATTGYSLVVDHEGHVLQRIPIGKQAVIFHDVEIRTGRTVYSRTGDALVVGVIVLIIVAGVLRRRRTTTR